MTRTIQQELKAKGFTSNDDPKNKELNQKKHKEELSKREIEELMGMRMPKYKKNRGSFRQR